MKTAFSTLKLHVLLLLFALSGLSLGRAQTVVWLENFDDGNGDSRWAADGTGTWQMGSPTFGPQTNAMGCRVHSCPNCATTSLTGSYLANQDSRLKLIALFPIPPANQFPRLRFWQWYSIGGGDHAYVEIKPVGSNTWTTISPDYGDIGNMNYVRNGGGIWTRPSLDLSAFAGQTVQLAFHFTSDPGSAVAPNAGWFVDDVALVTGTPVFNSPEGFESGLGDWAVDKGTWEVGSPTAGPPTNRQGSRAFTGTNCAGFVMAGGNYQPNVDSRLISPPVLTIPPANQFPRLRFWQWYSIGGGDHAYVEIKPVGSNTWTTISPDYGDIGNMNYVRNGGGIWTRPSLDLSAFAGQTVQLAFHFTSDPGSAVAPNAGWFVDDVALVTGTPVFNSPEGFESGLGDWAVDKGTWEVGSPTAGPPTNRQGSRAFTGTNCAGFVMAGGNYQPNVDSRLISPPVLTIPPANQFPRLRFWQWYSIGGGDHAYVEIKPVGSNTWTTISPDYGDIGNMNYVRNGGGIWTRPSLDLSAFAGQTVQLAFHFTSDPGSAVAPNAGWFVDDVALVTGTPVFNSPEGFESGLGDWAVDKGTWEVGVPTSGPSSAYTGTNCAATVLAGNYPANADSRLISAPFTLPPLGSSPALRFRSWFRFASGDLGMVEIKPTNAGVWTGLITNSGINGQWTYPDIDLSSFGGQTVQLAFHIVSDNNSGSVDAGWYLDDIVILSAGCPVILAPPSSQTNLVGTALAFNVSASGDLPLSYQWRFNASPIAGATSPMLTLTNVQLWESGYYDVVVTNAECSVTSTPPAQLQVIIGFSGNDVGDTGAPGSFTNANGTYTVNGSGEGTDGSADVFYFVHQPLAGDAEIIARLQNLQGGDPSLAEAGVMIRETLDGGSKSVSLSVSASGNVPFRRRLLANSHIFENGVRGTNYLQGTNYVWLRLMRMGNTFVAHYSTDGLDWRYLWFTTLNMSNQVEVGLEVTSHHYGEITTATFDNVSIGSLTPLSGVWPLSGPLLLLGGQDWSPAEFQRVGGFEFLVAGGVGESYSINGAPDLTLPAPVWSLLGTVTNIYGVVPFVDAQALTNQTRYYRAKKLAP